MNETLCLLAALVGPCPNCGNGRLQAVHDGDLTNFVCPGCGTCWHPEHDVVRRIDPETCPGCSCRDLCARPEAPERV